MWVGSVKCLQCCKDPAPLIKIKTAGPPHIVNKMVTQKHYVPEPVPSPPKYRYKPVAVPVRMPGKVVHVPVPMAPKTIYKEIPITKVQHVIQKRYYDCVAGIKNWNYGWSKSKKSWCCSHEQKGCPGTWDGNGLQKTIVTGVTQHVGHAVHVVHHVVHHYHYHSDSGDAVPDIDGDDATLPDGTDLSGDDASLPPDFVGGDDATLPDGTDLSSDDASFPPGFVGGDDASLPPGFSDDMGADGDLSGGSFEGSIHGSSWSSGSGHGGSFHHSSSSWSSGSGHGSAHGGSFHHSSSWSSSSGHGTVHHGSFRGSVHHARDADDAKQ